MSADVNDLFDFGAGGELVLKATKKTTKAKAPTHNASGLPNTLPSLVNGFMDLHFNGVGKDLPKGKTTWGLTLDIQRSKFRYHFNFETVDEVAYGALLESPNTGNMELEVIQKAIGEYLDMDGLEDPNIYITPGRFNTVSGSRKHKLVDDYRTAAILIVHTDKQPEALVYYGREFHRFDDWTDPQSKNKTIIGRERF